MSRTDDEQAAQPAKRVIFGTRERVQEVRNIYHRERVNGSVSPATHRELATAALQYRDVLAEHSEEGVVRDKWEESGVDGLETLVGETRVVEVEAPGRTANTRTERKPAVLTVPHYQIYQATKALDTLAKELGFAASAREKTASEEASMSDLRGLLKGRGQKEAMQFLPGGGEGGDDSEE